MKTILPSSAGVDASVGRNNAFAVNVGSIGVEGFVILAYW